jgi:hypothetical protein
MSDIDGERELNALFGGSVDVPTDRTAMKKNREHHERKEHKGNRGHKETLEHQQYVYRKKKQEYEKKIHKGGGQLFVNRSNVDGINGEETRDGISYVGDVKFITCHRCNYSKIISDDIKITYVNTNIGPVYMCRKCNPLLEFIKYYFVESKRQIGWLSEDCTQCTLCNETIMTPIHTPGQPLPHLRCEECDPSTRFNKYEFDGRTWKLISGPTMMETNDLLEYLHSCKVINAMKLSRIAALKILNEIDEDEKNINKYLFVGDQLDTNPLYHIYLIEDDIMRSTIWRPNVSYIPGTDIPDDSIMFIYSEKKVADKYVS